MALKLTAIEKNNVSIWRAQCNVGQGIVLCSACRSAAQRCADARPYSCVVECVLFCENIIEKNRSAQKCPFRDTISIFRCALFLPFALCVLSIGVPYYIPFNDILFAFRSLSLSLSFLPVCSHRSSGSWKLYDCRIVIWWTRTALTLAICVEFRRTF